jgi:hypothetical protein
LLTRSNNDEKLKNYYLGYSKILSKVIKAAKKLYYNNKVSQSHNKIKATWNVIKSETGGSNNKEDKLNTKNNCGDHSKN